MTEASQCRDARNDTAPAWNTLQRRTEKGDSAGDNVQSQAGRAKEEEPFQVITCQKSVKMHSGECGVSLTGLGS